MQYSFRFSLAIIEDFESFAEMSVSIESTLLFLKLCVDICCSAVIVVLPRKYMGNLTASINLCV